MAVIMSLNMVYWAFKGIFHCLLIGIKNSEIPRNTFVVEAFSSSKLENLRSLNIQFGPYFCFFWSQQSTGYLGGWSQFQKASLDLRMLTINLFWSPAISFCFYFSPIWGLFCLFWSLPAFFGWFWVDFKIFVWPYLCRLCLEVGVRFKNIFGT